MKAIFIPSPTTFIKLPKFPQQMDNLELSYPTNFCQDLISEVSFQNYYLGFIPFKVASFRKFSRDISSNPADLEAKLQTLRIAVVVIDMQDNFLKKLPSGKKEELIASQIDILNSCAKYAIPTAIIEYNKQENTVQEIQDAVQKIPQKGYFIKHHNDSFKDRIFTQRLKEWGVNTLLLMGVNAGACVYDTASSALATGYTIATSEQLIGDDIISSKYGSRIDWYKKNTIFAQDYHAFLTLFEKSKQTTPQ